MNRTREVIGVASIILILAGCSTQATTGQVDSDNSAVQPTARAPRHVDKSDRAHVTFDPCLDIPDSALIEAGYNPATEKNADFTPDEYTFLGCSYKTPERLYGMNVLSGNITFAEEVEKSLEHATPIDINGRRGLLKFDTGVTNSCDLSMETSFGIFGLTRSIFPNYPGPAPEAEWCAGLEDTARIFERYIPKEG
ncbi:DUF3558 domain-containing protein [Rhodococcus opacus]|uniref:DUF3558 domain-containing protein n=1 Tax=Rhodococcus opacus TaxID=37919 RepID=A0A076ESL3_RHOOP|nr:DUF3558 domain-containing protein [Rhodococcus opacus]AII08836.1 hypothetical protein EP51_31105 [Rhodococcus opacus]